MLPLALLALLLLTGSFVVYQNHLEVLSTVFVLLDYSWETVLTVSATSHYAFYRIQPILTYRIDGHAGEQLVDLAHFYLPLIYEYLRTFSPTSTSTDPSFVLASTLVFGGEKVVPGSNGLARLRIYLAAFALTGSLFYGFIGMFKFIHNGRATARARSNSLAVCRAAFDCSIASTLTSTSYVTAPAVHLVEVVVYNELPSSGKAAIATVEDASLDSTLLSAPSSPKVTFLSLPALDVTIPDLSLNASSTSSLEFPTSSLSSVNQQASISPIDTSVASLNVSTRLTRSIITTTAIFEALDDVEASLPPSSPKPSSRTTKRNLHPVDTFETFPAPRISLTKEVEMNEPDTEFEPEFESKVNFSEYTPFVASTWNLDGPTCRFEELPDETSVLGNFEEKVTEIVLPVEAICGKLVEPVAEDKSTSIMSIPSSVTTESCTSPLLLTPAVISPEVLMAPMHAIAAVLEKDSEEIFLTSVEAFVDYSQIEVEEILEEAELEVLETCTIDIPTNFKPSQVPNDLPSSTVAITHEFSLAPLSSASKSLTLSTRTSRASQALTLDPYPKSRETRRILVSNDQKRRRRAQRKLARYMVDESEITAHLEEIDVIVEELKESVNSHPVQLCIEANPAVGAAVDLIHFGSNLDCDQSFFLPRQFLAAPALATVSTIVFSSSLQPPTKRREEHEQRQDERSYLKDSRGRRISLRKDNFVACAGGKRRRVVRSYEGASSIPLYVF